MRRDRDAADAPRLLPAALLATAALLAGCAGLPAPTPTGEAILVPTEASDDQLVTLDAAEEARAAGDYDAALELFQEVLAENPTLTDAYLGIGDVHAETGRYDLAEPAFRRAARLEPRSFDAQYGHGFALQMLGRFVEAIRAYHRALVIDPEDFDANANISLSYLRTEDPENALAFAERAVAIDPDDGRARANLGAIHERLGNLERAIEHYLVSIEILGNEPPLLMNLVGALAAERRYEEAANTAETLVRLDPTPNAFERLGWCRFKLREYDASMVAYENAVGLDPEHWPSLNGIGVNALNTWLLSDRRDADARIAARDAFRRSLRANPEQDRVAALMLNYGL